jgi:hypothetical protein
MQNVIAGDQRVPRMWLNGLHPDVSNVPQFSAAMHH